MYTSNPVYRATVSYSSTVTGQITVRIPSLAGADSTFDISYIGRSSFADTWVVPAIGEQIVVTADDANFTNVFWLQTDPVNIAEIGSALSGTSYTTVIGNGTSTSYTVTHGLNSRDIIVVARNAFSPYEVIEVQWEATSTTSVTFNFSTPPSSNSVSVTIYSATTGDNVALALDDLTNVTVPTPSNGDLLKFNGSQWVNTASGQDVFTTSNVTFNDLIVNGNLTVNGDTTTLNTATLLVEDNIITVNSNVTGSPTTNAGIEVERGTSPNVAIRWNETTDKWQFTNDGTTYTDLGSGSGGTSVTVSDTAPVSPTVGSIWYESDTGSMYVYYDSYWVEVGGSTAYDQIIGSIQAKGDLLAGTGSQALSRVAVGTNNTRLIADSTATAGVSWASDTQNTVIDAKGDLLVGLADNTVGKLTVGTNGQILVADSSQTAGVGWTELNTRNLLYNGAMQVHQRVAAATAVTGITSSGYRTADRWDFNIATFGTWTQSVENDAPSGSGFRKSWKTLCTTASASPAAGNEMQFRQKLEGVDLQAIRKGTTSATQLTISFWVKSNRTGTYICELEDQDNNRNVSASYAVNVSGTWEYKTITFPADATGAFDNDANSSLAVIWWLGAGSNFTSGTLATTWVTPTASNRAVGQVNLASATNNYWQITGVQLNVGPVAAPFEFKSYERELRECQRYYIQDALKNRFTFYSGGDGYADTNLYTFPTTMRIAPQVTVADNAGTTGQAYLVYGAGSFGNATVGTFSTIFGFGLTKSGMTTNVAGKAQCSFTASAEL